MIKKIIFSLIIFSSLFIGKEAFASDYFDLNISSSGDFFTPTYNQLDLNLCAGQMLIIGPVDNFSMPIKLDGSYPYGRTTEEASINNCNSYIASRWSGGGDFDNYKSSYPTGTDEGNYWIIFGGQYESSSQSVTDFNLYTGVNYSNGVWSDIASPTPPASDISDILLPDNTTSLDDITEAISAPAGLNVYFTNYEINPYAYLHINLITCSNGINDGCNSFNETERFFSIPISYLGYSEDENDLLLYKFNLQGLVTQNDYISVSYKLSNCDYNISVCPEGNSSGRSYQFLVNNSLTEGTWVDFEDEARPECTFARLDVCFINAMRWLFLPSPQLLSDITSITFSDRIPFSYIYDLDNLYEEAFNDTPKDINIAIAFGSFGNITLLSTDKLEAIPFQGTVRTILGAILIFGTVMFIYKKVLTINDRREVTEKQ